MSVSVWRSFMIWSGCNLTLREVFRSVDMLVFVSGWKRLKKTACYAHFKPL